MWSSIIFKNWILYKYRQQLIEQIVDFRNTTEYEILHNNNMEFYFLSSNEDNCSPSDSYSNMNVGNVEEHKKISIYKQKQINENLLVFSQWSKYCNAPQIYKTIKPLWSEKK